MNKSKLLKRFRMLSRVMSNRGDITINLTGNRCYTDYNSITLPVGDLENPDYLELLEGAIDHEVGHLRWTDRTWTAKSYEKGAFFNAIRNGIEDIRMERMVCLEWPGAILNLSKMVTQGIKKGWFSKPTDSFPPSLLLQAVVVYYGRYKINNQVQLKEFCEIALALLTDCIGQKPVQDLILLLDTIPTLQSNQHSYELTEQIIQLLKKIEFEPGDSQGDDSGDSQGQNSNVSQQVINFVNECLNADESQLMADLHEQVNNELEKMADEVRSSNDMEQLIQFNAPSLAKVQEKEQLNMIKKVMNNVTKGLNVTTCLNLWGSDISNTINEFIEFPVDIIGIDFVTTKIDKYDPITINKMLACGLIDAKNTKMEEKKQIIQKLKAIKKLFGVNSVSLIPSWDFEFIPETFAKKKIELMKLIKEEQRG